MTLKEFVKAFMEANNIDKDVDQMCAHITAEAKKIAESGCACLDEEQVEQIILGAELKPVEKAKPEIKKAEPVKMEDVKKPHKAVKPEKKYEDQLSIFEMGVGLYD